MKIWQEKKYSSLFLLCLSLVRSLSLTHILPLSSELTPFLDEFPPQGGRRLPAEAGILPSEHQLDYRGVPPTPSHSSRRPRSSSDWSGNESITVVRDMWCSDWPAWCTRTTSGPGFTTSSHLCSETGKGVASSRAVGLLKPNKGNGPG